MPGDMLLDAEEALLGEFLPDLFGYHILQLGRIEGRDLLDGSRIPHRVVLDIECPGRDERPVAPVAAPAQLPFAADALDVIVMPHVLEFERRPHAVLREVERILIPEGYLVLTGFNPWSLWGLWRLVAGWRKVLPWCGSFRTLPRIGDWLSLLGFEIVHTRTVFFRPPLGSERLMGRLEGMERAGARYWRPLGAAWVIVARKKVIAMTPVRSRWDRRRSLVAPGVAEPSTRDMS